MAIIYEVNLNVDASNAKALKIWLVKHLDKMLALPGFLRAELFNELQPAIGMAGLSLRYTLVDQAAFDYYNEHYAAETRQELYQRFGVNFFAQRRLLQRECVKERLDESENLST